ncbi:MAG: hypothetical protein EP335_12840 [Alphaproteobacteria bacterium]|nr:MAG: hypothetical protein EP335_12840 [Alphaproteobacteria bacterium]
MTIHKTLLGLIFGALLAAAPATAADLKPYQKAGLEKILAAIDPNMRAIMRQQLEPSLAVMTEEQVKLMVDSMTGNISDTDESEDTAFDSFEATEADLAFNEQQYEPVIRNLWQARRACEAFVKTTLKDLDPGVTYAVWGQAWRYDVRPLDVQVQTVYADYDLYALPYRGAAPTDGRYKFNFANVDIGCDQGAIRIAIEKAYRDYATVGAEFIDQVKAYKASEESRKSDGDAAYDIESRANQRVSRIQSALEEAIGAALPQGEQSLMTALMITAKRIQ